MFGPPGVKVAHLFTTFDFQSIFNILFQHEEAFRLPDTTLRVVVFSIGFLLLLVIPRIKIKNNIDFKNINNFVLLLFFIFYATLLNTDNVYNYIAILILLPSIFYYVFKDIGTLSIAEKLFISSFAIIFLLPFIHNSLISSGSYYVTKIGSGDLTTKLVHGNEASFAEIDNYLRFLFAIPIFLLFRKINYKTSSIIFSISVFSIIIGISSLYFHYAAVDFRVTGYSSTTAIFGNISILFSILSIFSIKYFKDEISEYKYLPMLAAILTFIAWGLTGTRGPIIIVLLIIIFFLFNKNIRNKYIPLSFKGFLILFIVTLALFSQSKVFERVKLSYPSTYNYIYEDSGHYWNHKDSIVPRINIWKGTINMIQDNMLSGVGLNNYNNALNHQILNGNIDPIRRNKNNLTAGLNHAHSQYLDIFAKTGIIGFLSLIYFILMNIYFFSSKLTNNNILALFGLITILTYSIHMMYHTILSHQQSILFVSYSLALLGGLSAKSKRKAGA